MIIEEKDGTECCIEGATVGVRSKRRGHLCFGHQLGEKKRKVERGALAIGKEGEAVCLAMIYDMLSDFIGKAMCVLLFLG